MTDWKKVPPELAARFLAALPDAANVERRQMFGCPCAFVNGNMFAGLHEDRLIVRLPDEAAQRPCVIMGRTMKQYALFPDAVRLTPTAMAQWVQRGHAFTSTLPAKVKKAAKAETGEGGRRTQAGEGVCCSADDEGAAPRRGESGQSPFRNPKSKALTASARSRWIQCPAPSRMWQPRSPGSVRG